MTDGQKIEAKRTEVVGLYRESVKLARDAWDKIRQIKEITGVPLANYGVMEQVVEDAGGLNFRNEADFLGDDLIVANLNEFIDHG